MAAQSYAVVRASILRKGKIFEHIARRVVAVLFVATSLSAHADADRTQLLSKYVFDVDFYLTSNNDVAAFYNGDREAATEHWVNWGFYEGRRASPFFLLSNYIYYNPDLAKAFGYFYELYLNHFLTHGIREGRVSSAYYDGRTFVEVHPDINAWLATNNYQAAVDHYMSYGIFEGRQASHWFSAREYLRVNPDLAAWLGTNYQMAVIHRAIWGRLEGRPLGNVASPPSPGGNANTPVMSGFWRSPQYPGERFIVTQNGYALKICLYGWSCGIGITGNMDIKHNVVLIGQPTSYGPQMQWTAKFDSPWHGFLRVDYCRQTTSYITCLPNAQYEVFKE